MRSFFAPRLDRELDDVRVYTGPHADATARSLDATAFTVGRHVVFRSSAYRPGTRQGTRLLAHELTHVAQQSTADRPRIQRQQADRPRESFEREQHDIVDFEFVDGRQQVRNAEGEKEGTRQTTGGKVDLHYDSGSGTFRCTFHLYWTFPPGWSDEQREQYRQRFAEVVGERWGEQHQLIEYAGSDEDAEPTGRTAKVVVDFEHVSMPAEYEQLSSLSARTAWLAESEHSEARQRKTRAFQVDVSPTDVTDSVRGREVNLDPGSLDAEESGVDRYRNYGRPEEITQHNMDRRLNPPYEHFEEAGVPLELPGEGTTYEQVAAAHEFGHMIGLADEYILDAEDLRNVPADEREEAIENRNAATGRIMNIGSRVTPDAYRPFARWLSSLTDSEWRVE